MEAKDTNIGHQRYHALRHRWDVMDATIDTLDADRCAQMCMDPALAVEDITRAWMSDVLDIGQIQSG